MSKKNRVIVSGENIEVVSDNTETKTNKIEIKNSKNNNRRDFIKIAVASGLGVCAIGTPICAGTRMVLTPVFQESQAGQFYPLAAVETLTEKPQKFAIVDNKRDAWTTLPNQKIGSLFVRKVGDNVSAFHSLCPHAGCMIQIGTKKNPQTGNDEEMFYCPCHAAHFDLNGKRLDGVSPRDLDSLEVKIENGKVFVKFENFTFGIAEKRV
ncbi:MAG: Rieske 2Fe-2S domain-containing protein [Planctomycetaceae bacterium]|jgi:Rieske Fe-S protein|nr:Rieske 2Fe-2S domain-containing protein [Planctomycetaceae bacterium]